MAVRAPSRHPLTTAAIPTRFSEDDIKRVDRASKAAGMGSRSAFIRAAVLEKVEAVEGSRIVEVRNVSDDQAIRLIDRYLKKHPGVHHVDDIADELGIELRVAFAASQKLLDRGRARVKEG